VIIILYVLDQLRPDFLSCYGFDRLTSPNIDAIAQDGILFKNAYATSSFTKPSGASILTGQYPRGVGMLHRLSTLPTDVLTLPEVLGEGGFHCIGLSTNVFISDHFGLARGFHEFISLPETMASQLEEKGRKLIADSAVTISNVPLPLPESQDLNEVVFSLALNLGEPIFIFLWSSDTHNPYAVRGGRSYFGNPLDTYIQTPYGHSDAEGLALLKSLYCDMIRHNDDSLGKLIGWLKEFGAYDSSLIIITSDHGEGFFEHGFMGHNSIVYEDQTKVPLIVKLPHNVYSRTAFEEPVSLVDIAPTILDASGLQTPELACLDGYSLIKKIKGEQSSPPVFFENQYEAWLVHSMGLRVENWKWMQVHYPMGERIPNPLHPFVFLATLKKKVSYWKRSGESIYDITIDPKEKRCSTNPQARQMKNHLRKRATELITTLDRRRVNSEAAAQMENQEIIRRLRDLGYM